MIQCCSSPSFQLVIEDVISMHSILGFDFEEHIKVVQLLESLRKIWPHFVRFLKGIQTSCTPV